MDPLVNKNNKSDRLCDIKSCPQKSRKKCPENVTIDLPLDGSLPTQLRAKFVKELIKYILYDRGQISESLDQMRQKVAESSSGKLRHRPGLAHRRRVCFLQSLDSVSSFVDDAFDQAGSVPQVALIFGATIVSPKESYIISFPPSPKPNATLSKPDSCLRKMLCRVVGSDISGQLEGRSKLSFQVPTCLHVAIKAPRDTQFANPHLFKPCLVGLTRISRRVTVTLAVFNTRHHEKGRDNHEDILEEGERRETACVVGQSGGAGDAKAASICSASNVVSFIPFCDNDNSEENSGEINNDVQINSSLPNIESLGIQEPEFEKRDGVPISKQLLNGKSEQTTESRSPSGILGDFETVASSMKLSPFDCDEMFLWFLCAQSVKGLKSARQ